ncbi:MAG: hypothetical protein LUQ66_04430 [Methanoregula sp.]|nr:hypothetical protein [Methanoregula sp.]
MHDEYTSALRRSADASLLIVGVLKNNFNFEFRLVRQNQEDEKNPTGFFEER